MTTYQDNPPKYFPLTIPNNSVPDVEGYYVTVTDTGTTNIFRKSKSGGSFEEKKIGEIPKKGTFAPVTGVASTEETQYFSSTLNATNLITNQAVPVVNRGIGGVAGGGNSKINTILGTNLASNTPPTRDEQVATTVKESLDNPTNLVNIDVGKANARTKYEDYYYPETLKGESDNKFKQDRIKFTMKLSTGTNINTNFGEQSFKRRDSTGTNSTGTIQGSVTLPIQPSITDSNSVDWQGNNLNAVGAYAAGASLSLMGSENLAASSGKILNAIAEELKKNNNQTYSNALKVYLAQEAVGLQGLLSRTSGAILNPNMELLFNAPSLRPFTFTFRLSPRSISEAKQVKNIIRFFKQGMSVKTTETSVFLKAPNIFDIRYISYDSNGKEIKDHPSLNRIKTCALTGCDVNYTPDGTYMTFNDAERTMTSYELSLRFTELDPVYDSDYSDSEGNAVSDKSSISGFNPDSSAIGINEIGF